MARLPRFSPIGILQHVIQRGNNRTVCFADGKVSSDPTYSGDEEDIKRINEAWESGTPLGNDMFREKVERQLRCKVGVARRGRPVKVKKGL